MTGIVDFRTSLLDEVGNPITSTNPLPTTGSGGGGGGGGVLDAYALNDLLEGTPMYMGKAKIDGTWLIQRFNSSTGEMRYANVSNNGGVTTYSSAWTNRTTLTYGLIQTLTGI
jgi:hypothetical protein